ncbi:MAG: peptidylprolyl isomerase [Erysipelotrichaceae bacterium]|nr:peptidylprolyl isomerase [Erysipelotrichaceae bacterium]MBQ5444239.1 peptidylprolyl isomerase [Erysipelotrichaceae bacterium]
MVIIEMNDGRTIKIELDEQNAPITCANFLKLVNEHFYDGLTFHRIIAGFMIQGGDPTGTGMGGSAENIKGEFLANGVNNRISHKRGVISMARAQSFNSASSQFFICHADSEFLDGNYAAFGHVVEGIETVDAIANVRTGYQDRPVEPVIMKRVYIA